MDIDFALLADAATVPADNKLYILGGGIRVIHAPGFPYSHHAMTLVISFVVAPHETEKVHQLELQLRDSEGKLGGAGITGQFSAARNPDYPRWPVVVPVVLTYANTVFPLAGEYQFEIMVDGRILKTLPLYVVPVPSPHTTPAA